MRIKDLRILRAYGGWIVTFFDVDQRRTCVEGVFTDLESVRPRIQELLPGVEI